MRRRYMVNSKPFDYSNYMTIEPLELVSFKPSTDVEYTIDGVTWRNLGVGQFIYLQKGVLCCFRCVLSKGERIQFYDFQGEFNLKGNSLSLVFGDEAKGNVDLTGYDGVFSSLFSNSKVVNVEKGFLPATTLAYSCYDDMFSGCASLVNAPELPATTLAYSCYDDMFSGCASLVNAPELPATTLADYCYHQMFSYCKSLVNAPELPATTLADYCYHQMFSYCKSLVNAPELPATTLKPYCYGYMFYYCTKLSYIKAMFTTPPGNDYTYSWVKNVASSGTFVKNKNATWGNTFSEDAIPEGWTVLTE